MLAAFYHESKNGMYEKQLTHQPNAYVYNLHTHIYNILKNI